MITRIILATLAGMMLWTLAEYLLHRFLGHVHKGKNFFKTEHLQHHAKTHYFAPVTKKLAAGILVCIALFFLLLPFTRPLSLAGFLLGFFGMYALYEVTHYRYHARKPLHHIFLIMRKHHFYHHFHNPQVNHGVTTRLWDRVFGTFVPVEKVRVPRKLAMEWLLEEEEVNPAYASYFYLTRKLD